MPNPDRASVAADRPARAGIRSRGFRGLLVATFAALAGFILMLPVVPLWAMHGGAHATGAGGTTGVFMAATVLGELGMPYLLRRFAGAVLFAAGSLVFGGFGLLLLVSDGELPLLVVSAGRGLGFGVLAVAGSALVPALVPPEQWGRGAGLYGLATAAPYVVSLPAGAWFVQAFGFGPILLIGGLLPLLGGVLAILAVPRIRPVDRHRSAPRDGGRVAVPAVLVAPSVVMVLVAVAATAMFTFLPGAVTGGVGTATLLAFGAATAFSRWGAGQIGDRTRGAGTLIAGSAAAAVGMLGLTAAVRGGTSGAGVVLAVGGALLVGAGYGSLQNQTLVVMLRRTPVERHGMVSTLWNVALDLGTGVGAVLLGVVADGAGYTWLFAVAAMFGAACLPLALVGRRRGPAPGVPAVTVTGAETVRSGDVPD